MIVWGVLLASMTLGAGALLIAGGGDAGVRPVPLANLQVAGSLEAVLATERPLDRQRWKAIVIHHSGTPYETGESIDRRHREMGLRGLGHHFVIGSGSGIGDGEVLTGFRWRQQLPGAHARGPDADWYDRHAISICLVGNGDRRPFTQRQLARTRELVSRLMVELDLTPSDVVLHSAIAPTTDPGWNFPEAWFYEQLAGAR